MRAGEEGEELKGKLRRRKRWAGGSTRWGMERKGEHLCVIKPQPLEAERSPSRKTEPKRPADPSLHLLSRLSL